MNRNATIKICLGSAHFHCHGKALQHFIAALSNNMKPNHLLLFPSTDWERFSIRKRENCWLGYDVDSQILRDVAPPINESYPGNLPIHERSLT